jgi:hypothetical protein
MNLVHRVAAALVLLVLFMHVGCAGTSDDRAPAPTVDAADADGSVDTDAGALDASDAGSDAPGQPSCSIIATDQNTMTIECTSGAPETSVACYASAPVGTFICELGCIRTRDRDCDAARAYQCADGHVPSGCTDAADAGSVRQVCCQ